MQQQAVAYGCLGTSFAFAKCCWTSVDDNHEPVTVAVFACSFWFERHYLNPTCEVRSPELIAIAASSYIVQFILAKENQRSPLGLERTGALCSMRSAQKQAHTRCRAACGRPFSSRRIVKTFKPAYNLLKHHTSDCAAASLPHHISSAGALLEEPCNRRQALNAAAAIAGGSLLNSMLPAVAIAQSGAMDPVGDPLPQVPHTPLAPGSALNISRVIKGCWQLSGGHKGEKDSDRTGGSLAVQDFGRFVDAGITTFDAADHYGPAEVLIGRFLQEHPELRSRVQVCTKYCVFSGLDMANISKASVTAAVDVSRQRLGVDKIDLLQFYWADYGYNKYVDASLYLTDLQAAGVIGELGVTNFDVPRLEAMVNKGANVLSNQVQYSLLDRRPANKMAKFCQAHNISMLPYGVVAGGFLSDKYLGMSPRDVNVNTYSKGKYASVLGQAGGWQWLQQLLQVMRPIADKHDTSISNIASRWVLQQAGVPAVILGARNAVHVPDHQKLFTFELDVSELEAIKAVLERGQQPKGDCYEWERGGVW